MVRKEKKFLLLLNHPHGKMKSFLQKPPVRKEKEADKLHRFVFSILRKKKNEKATR